MLGKSADTHLRGSLSEALEYLLAIPQYDTLEGRDFREAMVDRVAVLAQADALREAVALAEGLERLPNGVVLGRLVDGTAYFVSDGYRDYGPGGSTPLAAVQAALEAVHVGEPPLTPAESATPTEGQP